MGPVFGSGTLVPATRYERPDGRFVIEVQEAIVGAVAPEKLALPAMVEALPAR
jgi:hypothetical protein